MPKTPKRRAMRERITIRSKTTSPDSFGQPIPTWTPILSDIPATFHHVGGGESFRGSQVQADVIGVFEIRVTDLVTPSGSDVLWNGKSYGIVSIRPYEGNYAGGVQYVEIHVKAVA